MSKSLSCSTTSYVEPNVILLDELSGHMLLVKEYFMKEGNTIHFFSDFNFEDLNDFIAEERIDSVLVFLYGKKEFYKFLPILEQPIRIMICAHETEIWWLSEIMPEVNLVDMSLPKKELLLSIKSFLFPAQVI